MSALVTQFFPAETRTSIPVGGSVLWLELPQAVDAEQLFDEALIAGISTAPGKIFSPCNRYRNFVRLSFGHPWSERIDKSMEWLGNKVTALSKG
jgi:DNA-binding transcriptional MocR family regulator